MTLKIRIALFAVAIAVVGASNANAQFATGPQRIRYNKDRMALARASETNWHGNYAHVQYGQPIALVVPPTAKLRTEWGWGVSSTHITRTDHQFGRNWPGQGPFGGPFRPQPVWPQHTQQFGVYSVRGPW